MHVLVKQRGNTILETTHSKYVRRFRRSMAANSAVSGPICQKPERIYDNIIKHVLFTCKKNEIISNGEKVETAIRAANSETPDRRRIKQKLQLV